MNQSERRWRLLLGKLSDKSLGNGAMSKRDKDMQNALDYLYHRQYEKREINLGDIGKEGGSHSDYPTVLDWITELPKLFPDDVCETMRTDAIDKFEMTDLLKDPKTLSEIEPNQKLLESLLTLKGKMSQDVLNTLRRIIKKVVDDITNKLKIDIDSTFSGRRNRFRKSNLKISNNFDWQTQ